jgi:hypothetical protein
VEDVFAEILVVLGTFVILILLLAYCASGMDDG